MVQRWILLVCLYFTAAGISFAQIFPDQIGEALLTSLSTTYQPANVLSDAAARDILYSVIDRTTRDGEDGVACIYSDHFVIFDCEPSCDPSQDVFNNDQVNGINLEHSWPQSMGAGSGTAARDMHHLFPARAAVNSARGNIPFGYSPVNLTSAWYYLNQSQNFAPPAESQHLWSRRRSNVAFEPREEVRGDIARAMFYFYTMYGPYGTGQADDAFFEGMLEALLEWHIFDPPTQDEIDRTYAIANYQTTFSSEPAINPFVVDATLAERAFGSSEPRVFFASADVSYSSSEGIVSIPVYTAALDGPESVTVAYTGGTAVPGVDFTFTDTTLEFSPTDPSTTFMVALHENPMSGPVTVDLELQNPSSGLMLGSPGALTLTILPPAAEGVLVRYEFTGNSPNAQTVAGGMAASAFNVSSGSLIYGSFQPDTWNQGSGVPYVQGNQGWGATSQSSAKYFEFTVTPDAGRTLVVSQIDFAHRRTTAGPQQMGIQIGDTIILSGLPLAESQTVYGTFQFSPMLLTESTTIRVQGWAGGNGEFRLDDVALLGNVIETHTYDEIITEGGAGWRMLASPVDGPTVLDLANMNLVYGIPDEYPETAGVNPLIGYDGDTFVVPIGLSHPLVPGKGFIWYLWGNELAPGTTPDGTGISSHTTFPFKLSFTGSPVVENYQVTFTEDDRAATDDGWYLIGNPYTEPYNVSGIAPSTGLYSATLHHWDAVENEYVQLNRNNQDVAAVASGFFMQFGNLPTLPVTITFGPPTSGPPPLPDTGAGEHLIARFELTGELAYGDGEAVTVSDRNTRILFSEDATDDFDTLDAGKLTPLSDYWANIAIMGIQGDEVVRRSVESRPLPLEAVTIPMTLSTWAKGQDAAGTFTISLADNALGAGWQVSLYDLEMSETANLLTTDYTFSIESQPGIDGDERFEITIIPPSVSGEGSDQNYTFGLDAVWPNPTTSTAQVSFTLEEAGEINLEMFDVLGRRVLQVASGEYGTGRHVLPLHTNDLSSGIYVVRLISGSQTAVQRVTVVQ